MEFDYVKFGILHQDADAINNSYLVYLQIYSRYANIETLATEIENSFDTLHKNYNTLYYDLIKMKPDIQLTQKLSQKCSRVYLKHLLHFLDTRYYTSFYKSLSKIESLLDLTQPLRISNVLSILLNDLGESFVSYAVSKVKEDFHKLFEPNKFYTGAGWHSSECNLYLRSDFLINQNLDLIQNKRDYYTSHLMYLTDKIQTVGKALEVYNVNLGISDLDEYETDTNPSGLGIFGNRDFIELYYHKDSTGSIFNKVIFSNNRVLYASQLYHNNKLTLTFRDKFLLKNFIQTFLI